MNENEPVNENTTDSPEKRVADYVEDLCRHISDNGYDLLADVAVESLVANGAVPSGAYLHSVKTAWCLHRAGVHYVRQYAAERAAADRARGDAQFEHSHRVQAERKAERLEADLAQSVLLVENQRLRMEELRLQGADWCRQIRELQDSLQQRRQEVTASFTANQELRQKLESVEAALLEQQQQNERLVTHSSQQHMEIAELQGLLRQSRRRISELEKQNQEKQEPAIPAAGGLLRDVSHYTEMAETDTPDADVSAEQQIRTLQEIIDAQAETIAQLHSEVSALNTKVCELERMQKQDRLADSGTLDAATAEPQPEPVQVREGRWRTRGGEVRNVTPTPADHHLQDRFPWWDSSTLHTWRNDGRYTHEKESAFDLRELVVAAGDEPGSEQIAS